MGIIMLMVTSVCAYEYDNSFDTDEATISTPKSEIPKDGERFVTRASYPENTYEDYYEGEVIIEDGKLFFDGDGKFVAKYGDVIEGYFERNYIIKGKGSFEYGDTYEGEFKDNDFHGWGKRTYEDGSIYEGGFKEGWFHGQGKYTSEDGQVYEGAFVDDQAHGQGKMTFPDGTVEEGTFINGEFAGDSALPMEIDRDTDTYMSSYISLIPIEESGEMLVPLRYVGGPFDATFDWDHASKTVTIRQNETVIKMVIGSKTATVNGEKKELVVAPKLENNETVVPLKFISEIFYDDVIWDSEERIMYVRNKPEAETEISDQEEATLERTFVKMNMGFAKYEGEVILRDEEQILDGQGKLSMPGEWIYEGQFREGMPKGQGKMFMEDGSYYEGQVKDFSFEGQGKYFDSYGDIYEGEFKDSSYHGQGKLIRSDGDVYEGEFEDDYFHGQGKMTTADGEIYEGEFEYGSYLGE